MAIGLAGVLAVVLAAAEAGQAGWLLGAYRVVINLRDVPSWHGLVR
ncbi:hypothetical protein [Streptomyces mexicanus]